MRPDAVSPELAQAVFTRDRREVAAFLAVLAVPELRWKGDRLVVPNPLDRGPLRGNVVCPAVVIDFQHEWGNCFGRWRIEHVKGEPRLAKRAEPDMDHLMALCSGHTEDGMRAGHIWATAHRDEERDYIARANACMA